MGGIWWNDVECSPKNQPKHANPVVSWVLNFDITSQNKVSMDPGRCHCKDEELALDRGCAKHGMGWAP